MPKKRLSWAWTQPRDRLFILAYLLRLGVPFLPAEVAGSAARAPTAASTACADPVWASPG